jgi:hypothetical protein
MGPFTVKDIVTLSLLTVLALLIVRGIFIAGGIGRMPVEKIKPKFKKEIKIYPWAFIMLGALFLPQENLCKQLC